MNNIFQYQMVMAWVRSLLHDGIITQREYTKIDTKIANACSCLCQSFQR